MFVDMLNLPDLKKYDLSSLVTGYMAGAPCPQSIVKAVVQDLHMKDFVVYIFSNKNSCKLWLQIVVTYSGGLRDDRNQSSDFLLLF